jgi:hypothetical protein
VLAEKLAAITADPSGPLWYASASEDSARSHSGDHARQRPRAPAPDRPAWMLVDLIARTTHRPPARHRLHARPGARPLAAVALQWLGIAEASRELAKSIEAAVKDDLDNILGPGKMGQSAAEYSVPRYTSAELG